MKSEQLTSCWRSQQNNAVKFYCSKHRHKHPDIQWQFRTPVHTHTHTHAAQAKRFTILIATCHRGLSAGCTRCKKDKQKNKVGVLEHPIDSCDADRWPHRLKIGPAKDPARAQHAANAGFRPHKHCHLQKVSATQVAHMCLCSLQNNPLGHFTPVFWLLAGILNR